MRADAAHERARGTARRGAARPPARARRRRDDTSTRTLHVSSGKPGYETPDRLVPSSARSGTRGRCRTRSGCRGRATSSAASRSTSTPTSRPQAASHGCVRVPRYDAEVALRAARRRDAGDRAGVVAVRCSARSPPLVALCRRGAARRAGAAHRRRCRACSRSGSACRARASRPARSRARRSCLAKGPRDRARARDRARLGVKRVRFVNEPLFSTARRGRPEALGLRARRGHDHRRRRQQRLLLDAVPRRRPGRARPQGPRRRRGLARRWRGCSSACSGATTGADAVASRVSPRAQPFRSPASTCCSRPCAPAAATQPSSTRRSSPPSARQRRPLRRARRRIETDEQYGVVLPKGSLLTPRVSAAVRALVANGTIARLQRRWLATDLSKLLVLR